ncbi:MAG TPA: RNA polymerase sigma factor [Polyangiaceae bacterium]|nr:RNA polymerase sigma factor [Polyangiaceae bacterium]
MRSLSCVPSPVHFLAPSRESSAERTASSGSSADAAMDRYARGDDRAFAEVYDAIAPRVHAYLLRLTRNRVQADDLLQQTLLSMHRHRGTYASGFPVLPWAFAIARRLYIDEFRRRRTDALWSARSVADEDRVLSTFADEEMASRQTAERVREVLAKLPETQRVAFDLLRVEGLSHDEAAQVLGTTVGAVKLRAFRAYEAIRAVLNRSEDPR